MHIKDENIEHYECKPSALIKNAILFAKEVTIVE